MQPPLAGVVSACQALNICIAASVGGMHFGSIQPGSAGGSGGLQLAASLGLRSQQNGQLERHTLAVVPGHVSAEAAEPLEDALVSASSSIAGSREHQLAGLGLGLPGHMLLDDQPGQLPAPAGGSGSSWVGSMGGLPAADAAAPTGAAPRSRASVLDSPSELCLSPQEQQARQWLAPAQQQAASSSGGQPATCGGIKEGEGDVGTRGTLDAASEAALREAATDFMHPSHWAAARQAAAAAAAAAEGAALARSTSSSSSSDAHSFLLPGRRYSSSEGSSEAGGAAGRRRLSQQLDAAMGMPAAAAAAAAAVGQRQPALAAAAGSPGAIAAAAASGDAPLALYGQADHLLEADRQLTLSERLQLAVRAGQLLALFAPFLLLGTSMLLLAAQVDAAAARRRRQEAAVAAAADTVLAEAEPSQTASRLRTAAFKLLLGACRRRCVFFHLADCSKGATARLFAFLPCLPALQSANSLPCALLVVWLVCLLPACCLQRRGLHQVGAVGGHSGGHFPTGKKIRTRRPEGAAVSWLGFFGPAAMHAPLAPASDSHPSPTCLPA